MENFIDVEDLNKAFNKRNTDDMECEVLFPDGTIISSAKLHRTHAYGPMAHLTITIHGAETVINGESHFKDLKIKIIEEKKE